MRQSRSIAKTLVLAGCLAAILLGLPATLAFEEKLTSSADRLVFRNLIGEIQVEGHSGSDFQLEIQVRGDDATADRVKIETIGEGEIQVRFPLDESKRYVYPNGPGSTTIYDDDNSGWLSKILGKDRIKVSRKGKGLEIWADAKVLVPRGKTLIVHQGVGRIYAHDIQGTLSLDTGSGSVTVADVDGDLRVDTGSGGVSVSGVRGEKVHIDTGSGGVELDDIDSSTLYVDTGSGGVEAEGIGADELTIDTGSGSVTLELVRMGRGPFKIDTGSGGIDLKLPADASAEVEADTGSGGVRLDLTGIDMRHSDDGEAEFVIGGGLAKMTLDTGSGSIRVSR